MSINPSTNLEDTSVFELLDLNLLDCVNVLAVQPGFGGQKLQPTALEKVKRLRKRSKTLDIQVDGGVNLETIEAVVESGANVVVAGSFIFRENRGKEKDAVKMLRAFGSTT
jgi:ribulose-phosphate 3-epimerase